MSCNSVMYHKAQGALASVQCFMSLPRGAMPILYAYQDRSIQEMYLNTNTTPSSHIIHLAFKLPTKYSRQKKRRSKQCSSRTPSYGLDQILWLCMGSVLHSLVYAVLAVVNGKSLLISTE
eukprot:1235050-Rhodomonas_salina.2